MPEFRDTVRIAFAGGGSGGHIYPNLAVLEALEDRLGSDRVEAVFLVSQRRLDTAILQGEGRTSVAIPASPVSVHPFRLARLILRWGGSVRAAREAIRKLDAHAVVATGGFVSAPVMNAARAERVPLVLLNLDAVAGKANRWVGRKADVRLTAATGPGVPADWEPVRPVVRQSAMPRGSSAECRQRLGLDPERRTLLVTGGSQGARSINRLLAQVAEDSPGAFAGWQILHQCGSGDSDEQREAYRRAGVEAVCQDYLEDMASAWGAADLAVARCGAGTVAEIWAARVPAILLPYPYHRDQHQALNAEALSRANAAIVHTDRVDPVANASGAGRSLVELLQDDASRERMRQGFASLGPTDGAKTVAERLMGVLRV